MPIFEQLTNAMANANMKIARIIEGVSQEAKASKQHDTSQMYIRESFNLRVMPGDGTDVDEIDKFWFIDGYSRIGGPDVMWE